MYSIPLKVRIARGFTSEHSVFTSLLGLCALLLAIGFCIKGPTTNTNYVLLYEVASFKFWGTMYFIYGLVKIFGVFYRTYVGVKIANIILGMWLWSCLIFSFVIYDSAPIQPTELMLFVLLIAEVWSMSLTLVHMRYKVSRRATDGRN